MSEQTKTYKVKLAKGFHSMVADGSRLSNLRHTRGGVTLSSPGNTETVAELTKDQVEAIKNDPAFELTAVSANTAAPQGSGTAGGSKPATTKAPEGAPAPSTPPATSPAEGGSGAGEGDESQPTTPPAGEEGSEPASELPEATDEGGAGEGDEGSSDGPAHLDEAALKALKKGNRDGAVAAATERNIEVTDADTKAQIVDKIAASQAE